MKGDNAVKIKKIALLVLSLGALTLEALPYGAVLSFGGPNGEVWRYTYSYFSPVPTGYANFGPILTALLTCALLVMTAVDVFRYTVGLNTAVKYISGAAALISLSPVLYGINHFSFVGAAITLILAAVCGVSFIKDKKQKEDAE